MATLAEKELEYIALLEAEVNALARHKLQRYFPDEGPLRRELYPKHLEFFRAGSTHPLRLFSKANRVGGTEGMGCELAYHLTGEYPDWWEGKRFDHPIVAWAIADTTLKVKEIFMPKLFGAESAHDASFGTGIIPGDAIKDVALWPGWSGVVQSANVRHKNGRYSHLIHKTYEQGKEAFKGNEVHVVWADELMPVDILSECVVRIAATGWFEGGILAWTVTPEEGMTPAIKQFMPDGQFPQGDQSASQHYVVNATWDDVPHLSEAAKAQLESTILPYQLDARKRGIPTLGAGVVYPVAEQTYEIAPFEIPKHWPRGYGMDVGWDWTAVIWFAYDAETDTWYEYYCYKAGRAEPSVHAAAIRSVGEWIPGVIDPNANGRSQKDGLQLLQLYRSLGLQLTPAQNSVESGIFDVYERLTTSRLKMFNTLEPVKAERRLYSRDKRGHVIKDNDHLMDAERYFMNTGRHVAKQQPVADGYDAMTVPTARGPNAWMGG